MVFIKTMLLLCCLLILLSIVMPINCNKFNSKIAQSLKRFPRQVNANNDQQIGANDTHSLKKKYNFGTLIQSGFDGHLGVKNVMHEKSSGSVILPDRNNERRGRQLNIYSPTGSNTQNYQEFASQPWYLANKEYYDNYYANYYQSYYQTSTEQQYQPQQQSNLESPISQQQQHRPSQVTSQSNQQSSSNQLKMDSRLSSTLTLREDDGDSRIYIDENGLFQISKSNALNALNALNAVPPAIVDDDAIVFQSDESQYDRRTFLLNDNSGKQSRTNIDGDTRNSKTILFNGSPVFF